MNPPYTGRLLVATRSPDKLREIREILRPGAATLLTLDDAGVPADPTEDGIEAYDSFAENALAKATYFAGRTGMVTLADDSGIVVPALGGRPGVLSKRFAETLGVVPAPGERDASNLKLLLAQAADLGPHDRAAYYACAAALVGPNGPRGPRQAVFTGTLRGELALEPAGDGGFGYDPIFFVPSLGRTLAQIEPAAKHAISHRAHAFRALQTALANALEADRPRG